MNHHPKRLEDQHYQTTSPQKVSISNVTPKGLKINISLQAEETDKNLKKKCKRIIQGTQIQLLIFVSSCDHYLSYQASSSLPALYLSSRFVHACACFAILAQRRSLGIEMFHCLMMCSKECQLFSLMVSHSKRFLAEEMPR